MLKHVNRIYHGFHIKMLALLDLLSFASAMDPPRQIHAPALPSKTAHLKALCINSLQNDKVKQKANEDRYIIQKFTAGGDEFHLFGVFDGHGGKRVSEFLTKAFVKVMKKAFTDDPLPSDKLDVIERVIRNVDEQVIEPVLHASGLFGLEGKLRCNFGQ